MLCKADVDVPAWGDCPECGANADQECRGRGFLKAMAEIQKRRMDGIHGKAMPQFEPPRDKRLREPRP